MKVFVDTIPTKNGQIFQEVYTEVDGRREELMRTIIDTKEKYIKEALIKLGWSPPKPIQKKGDKK